MQRVCVLSLPVSNRMQVSRGFYFIREVQSAAYTLRKITSSVFTATCVSYSIFMLFEMWLSFAPGCTLGHVECDSYLLIQSLVTTYAACVRLRPSILPHCQTTRTHGVRPRMLCVLKTRTHTTSPHSPLLREAELFLLA